MIVRSKKRKHLCTRFVHGGLKALSPQAQLKLSCENLRDNTVEAAASIPVDSYTYASLLQNTKSLQRGKNLHAHIIITGIDTNMLIQTKLVTMYCNCGSLEYARQMFDKIPKPDVLLWNIIIGRYAMHNYFDKAIELYHRMQSAGVKPDNYTFPPILRACAQLGILQQGLEIHDYIKTSGFECNIFVENALIAMYGRCGRLEDARQVFDKISERDVVSWNVMIGGYAKNGRCNEAMRLFCQMQLTGVLPNLVTWNAVIAGYAQNGNGEEALKLFGQMQLAGVKPNEVTAASILPACAQLTALQQGKAIHGYAISSGFESNEVVENALIDMYAKCGSTEDACNIFGAMSNKTVVSWNAMIAGYAHCGHDDEGLRYFQQMHLAGMKPNNVTIVSVLPIMARLAMLQQGKEIHNFILRNGLESHIVLGNALIDMYAKCGNIRLAESVFDQLSAKDIVSWTAIIAGHGMQGNGEQAVALFSQMQQSGMKPDHIFFVALLSACSHSGLVAEGWQHFHAMRKDYGITPRMEHYACMVDLLGRAGCLDEAEEFIKNMPLEPSAAVWGTMLGACRIHSNIGIGERVAECLFNLKPETAGYYVLMSNMYSAAGRWDDVAKVRKTMREQGLQKNPGCAWIEIKNKVYAFRVGDRSQPQSEAIYATLENLAAQMKEEGYVPDTNFVLHDVEDEEKEYMLCGHSEKLAIIFGLINTCSGTPLRIIKNLRVCGDCHSATKVISKIVGREITVRDANRFHHFKDGLCSCGDYW